MANKSIFDAFERMWQHVVARFGNYATSESFNSHVDNKSNPHEVTKEQVGLGNVDNTADAAKVVLSATKATQDANGNNIAATYETKSDAESKLTESKAYSDAAAAAVKNDLLNGAGEAYDTLKELGELIDENTDVLQALEEVATSKADKSDIVQSDWDQNDIESLDYVKNRTHYEEEIIEVILEEQIVEFRMTPANYVADFSSNFSLIENENYTVIWDGISYDITCQYDSVIGGHYLGDKNYLTSTSSVGDIPFAIIVSDAGIASSATNSTETSHTIGIIKHTINIHTLDEKYIPDTIARDLDLEVINYNLTNQINHNAEQILRIDETVATKEYINSFLPKTTTITLLAENWTGDTNPWSQVITINGVTVNSKIDLQPTALQIIELQNTDIAMMTENNDGVITVYALGSKPTVDYTMQVLITEVVPV